MTSGPNRSQAINITPTSGLTSNEIDRLVGEGEKFKETDQLRRDLAELRNQAETLLYTTEQALEGYADLLGPEKVEAVREDVERAQENAGKRRGHHCHPRGVLSARNRNVRDRRGHVRRRHLRPIVSGVFKAATP